MIALVSMVLGLLNVRLAYAAGFFVLVVALPPIARLIFEPHRIEWGPTLVTAAYAYLVVAAAFFVGLLVRQSVEYLIRRAVQR